MPLYCWAVWGKFDIGNVAVNKNSLLIFVTILLTICNWLTSTESLTRYVCVACSRCHDFLRRLN